ncbi:MAG: heavy metal-responsive transcriptional regulator [Pseudomonadota bacterium]
MSGYTVSQLASATGIGADAVRHYEDIGLLPKAQRSGNGYRYFAEDAIPRIAFIQRAKHLGFSLPEIAELLRLSDQRYSDSESDMVLLRTAALSKAKEIEGRIRELQQIAHGLQQLIQTCPGAGQLRDCPILGALSAPSRSAISPCSKPKPALDS